MTDINTLYFTFNRVILLFTLIHHYRAVDMLDSKEIIINVNNND